MRISSALSPALLAASLLASTAAASVTVTPSAVYINASTRSGSVTLINTGTRAEDIEITFGFGYPRVDATGAVIVPIVPIAPDSEPSAAQWLRAFPQRVRLLPGQRQVVRIIAEPPTALTQQEFWARMLVHSRGAQAPVEQRQQGIQLQLDVETVLATAVSFRNGNLTTGLQVVDRGATVADSTVKLALDLTRTGTAAYIGHLHAELVDPSGKVVSDYDEDVAIYRTMSRTFLVPVRGSRPGAGYTVRYTLTTDRPDLPPGSALPAAAIKGQVAVR